MDARPGELPGLIVGLAFLPATRVLRPMGLGPEPDRAECRSGRVDPIQDG
jgi:hypothetical protein